MLRAIFPVALLAIASTAVANPAHFHDDTFVDADWTVFMASFEVSGVTAIPGGTATGAQQATGGSALTPGGNPAFRLITHVVPAAPSPTTFGATWSAHFHTGFVYDPSTAGPIATIDYAEDARAVSGSNLGQSAGLALRQGGDVFVAQIGTTGDPAWTHKEGLGLTPSRFGLMTVNGFPGGKRPDFSAAGGPIEVGFVRGNSTGAGGASYTIAAAIDNWDVRLNPPCTTATECDDDDPCTIDTCASGVCASTPLTCNDSDGCTIDTCDPSIGCTHAPVGCDDGLDCTADACVAGACQNQTQATFDLVEHKIDALIAHLKSSACAGQPLAKKAAKKLRKGLTRARGKVARADAATRATAIQKLLGKASGFLAAGRAYLVAATQKGQITPACAGELGGFLAEVEQCVDGLPR